MGALKKKKETDKLKKQTIRETDKYNKTNMYRDIKVKKNKSANKRRQCYRRSSKIMRVAKKDA